MAQKKKNLVFGKVPPGSEWDDAWLHEDVDTDHPLFDFRDMPKLLRELGLEPDDKKK